MTQHPRRKSVNQTELADLTNWHDRHVVPHTPSTGSAMPSITTLMALAAVGGLSYAGYKLFQKAQREYYGLKKDLGPGEDFTPRINKNYESLSSIDRDTIDAYVSFQKAHPGQHVPRRITAFMTPEMKDIGNHFLNTIGTGEVDQMKDINRNFGRLMNDEGAAFDASKTEGKFIPGGLPRGGFKKDFGSRFIDVQPKDDD